MKLVGMDIGELRGWAALMDKAMIASLVATIVAVAALGITTWLSYRFSGAVRAHEQAAFDRYKGIEGHSAELERDVATARERMSTLEQEVTAARERTAMLEREASAARDRATAYGQAAREANERASRADRETAAAGEKERAAQLDAAEIRQRLDELGKRVREATAVAPSQVTTTEAAPPVQAEPSSPAVASLRKYAGTRAAIFVVDQVADAPAAAAAISATLGDAGWATGTWKWSGVAGIFGVVVLVRQGSDPATDEAASALAEALRGAGFSATKADWPAEWHRFRGMLDGPQTPGPTDGSIRIVVGTKPR
jgi:hypothetical protein